MEKRRGFLDELLEELDDTCSFILAAITRNPEGIGFNELYRKIRENPETQYNKMAKSSLSKHLTHLVDKTLVEKKVDKESKLKLKPSKYMPSQYFKDLSKGFIAQSTSPKDYMPLMRSEDVRSLTSHLMFIINQHLTESLSASLVAPEKIFIWNVHQAFHNIETLMRAYKERVLESKEESEARKALQYCRSNISQTLRTS
jgi:hypothetical protein